MERLTQSAEVGGCNPKSLRARRWRLRAATGTVSRTLPPCTRPQKCAKKRRTIKRDSVASALPQLCVPSMPGRLHPKRLAASRLILAQTPVHCTARVYGGASLRGCATSYGRPQQKAEPVQTKEAYQKGMCAWQKGVGGRSPASTIKHYQHNLMNASSDHGFVRCGDPPERS